MFFTAFEPLKRPEAAVFCGHTRMCSVPFSGTHFLRTCGRRPAFGAPIPAFLISGDTAPERLREGRESGHHLLHKPVRPMRLRAMVSQLLQGEFAGAA
jgi:hypothetical protein